MITMQMPNNFNWDKAYKWFMTICLMIVGGIIFSIMPKCSKEPVIDNTIQLKKEIIKDKALADSVKRQVIYKDSIRIVYVNKYRDVKTYINLPCDTVLKLVEMACDSIIIVDSSEIASLKAEILIDGLIINNQDKLIRMDSITIMGLNKSIRKHKRQKKLIAGGMGALLLISLLRK